MSIQLNTDGITHELENVLNKFKILYLNCEGENLNYVEIVEKYGHLD